MLWLTGWSLRHLVVMTTLSLATIVEPQIIHPHIMHYNIWSACCRVSHSVFVICLLPNCFHGQLMKHHHLQRKLSLRIGMVW